MSSSPSASTPSACPRRTSPSKTMFTPPWSPRKTSRTSPVSLRCWATASIGTAAVDTTDPQYYKWTQWIFLQLFKHGLAYKTTMPVNWCTSCKCVLANEEVVEGVCERCGSEVVRKEKSQWMLRITKYADRLIDDLDDLDFIERVKIQQKQLDRPLHRYRGAPSRPHMGDDVTVYTTRADTLFGTTYMVISPEHPHAEEVEGSDRTTGPRWRSIRPPLPASPTLSARS